MFTPDRARRVPFATMLLLVGCTHSDSFASPPISTVGPFSSGPDIQITFNPDADYWPSWTQDGRGILYAYVDRERTLHRCLGMLAPEGGTRLWQLCDNRVVRDDTVSSYEAFAMDSSGRLLVAEAVSNIHDGIAPLPRTNLWLADTAHPYARATLLVLPVTVGPAVVTWLADIQWTGPNAFIALGQQFESGPHCVTIGIPMDPITKCETRDTIFADAGLVVAGTITGSHATLQAIVGTDSATSYSLAENGSSIVFTRHHDLRLFRVPVGGGAPQALAIAQTGPDSAEFVGVSCKGATCIVARDEIVLTHPTPCCEVFAHFSFLPPIFLPQSVPSRTMTLRRVSLSSGANEILQSNQTNTIFATPQISPVSGDVVVQVGGGWGHLQTFGTAGTVNLFALDGNSVLHLLKGIVP